MLLSILARLELRARSSEWSEVRMEEPVLVEPAVALVGRVPDDNDVDRSRNRNSDPAIRPTVDRNIVRDMHHADPRRMLFGFLLVRRLRLRLYSRLAFGAVLGRTTTLTGFCPSCRQEEEAERN